MQTSREITISHIVFFPKHPVAHSRWYPLVVHFPSDDGNLEWTAGTNRLGGDGTSLDGDARTALWCVAATLIWQAAGYYMVMHIAAMDGISAEVYEAATIDGAGSMAKFFRITLPLIKNIIGITYVLSLSGTLSLSYILVRVMTGGGPNGASSVVLNIFTIWV